MYRTVPILEILFCVQNFKILTHTQKSAQATFVTSKQQGIYMLPITKGFHHCLVLHDMTLSSDSQRSTQSRYVISQMEVPSCIVGLKIVFKNRCYPCWFHSGSLD